MSTAEALPYLSSQELKRLELYARKAIDPLLSGLYDSKFHGAGVSFSELREYEAGDDVRTIHWKSSLRSLRTLVRTFEHERALNIFLLIDASNSMRVALPSGSPYYRALQFSSLVVSLAEIKHDALGYGYATEKLEKFRAPKQGASFLKRFFAEFKDPYTESSKTNLNATLKGLLYRLKRRSLIFLMSDFLGNVEDSILKAITARHVCVFVNCRSEMPLPEGWILHCRDAETSTVGSFVYNNSPMNQALLERARNNGAYVVNWEEDPKKSFMKLLASMKANR